jgi:ribonuclease HII
MLSKKYHAENKFEIGIDEAGRGPMFGRLYVAAVILGDNFPDNLDIKDSKKIKSKKKMITVSNYIKQHAAAWAIHSIEHNVIDEINIRQAVFQGMNECIQQVIYQLQLSREDQCGKTFLLIDGNDFIPNSQHLDISYKTIEGGDNTYMAIAAASILAKSARDEYIRDLCDTYPALKDRYKLDQNMGYGTKAHLDGIVEYGITQWHRKTYGRCKTASYSPIT